MRRRTYRVTLTSGQVHEAPDLDTLRALLREGVVGAGFPVTTPEGERTTVGMLIGFVAAPVESRLQPVETVFCLACRAQIIADAKWCPECGRDPRARPEPALPLPELPAPSPPPPPIHYPSRGQYWEANFIGVVVVAVVLWVAIARGCQLARERAPVVTRAEFERIQVGMTYDEVRALVGDPGTVDGVRATVGDTTIEVEWVNPSGSGVVVTFTGGRVATKSQTDL